ncbi:hypothetical protein Q5752_004088 [Cryptotrichosporon argae]
MPRRKNAYLSDGSDSDASGSDASDYSANSQEDADSRAERRLFEHKGKRRRTGGGGGKAAAWEGVFGEGEDEGERRRARGVGAGGGGKGNKRTDWTKAPAFVPKSAAADEPTPDADEGSDDDDDGDGDDDDDSGTSDDSDDSGSDEDVTRPASPRVREDDDDAPATIGFGGSALRAASAFAAAGAAPRAAPVDRPYKGRGGIGSAARSGIGAGAGGADTPPETHGGIGSRAQAANELDEAATPEPELADVPSAFGRAARSFAASAREAGTSAPRQRFAGQAAAGATATSAGAGASGGPGAPAKHALTAQERSHFNKIAGSFGDRMLRNMGWDAGKGLGKNEDGRAVPVGDVAGLFAKKEGIKGGIRSEDSKREARRKGVLVDEPEDDGRKGRGKGKGRKGREAQPAQDDSWKRQRKVKVRVEHKTYDQLVAEAGDSTQAGVGLVIDARGGDLREVQSLSELSLSTWTPTNEAMQLPELRHNLRLILDMAKGDVDNLAREGRTVNERRRWALREEERAHRKVEETGKRIARLEGVQELAKSIQALTFTEAAKPDPSLKPLTESFEALLSMYKDEYKSLALDEVLVGAIAQILRSVFATWNPFDLSSDVLLSSLKQWRHAYNLPQPDETALVRDGDEVEVERSETMTAWESLLWNMWLPPVRSAINNEWAPEQPLQAVHLLESWAPLLSPFITHNILDQLVLPKLRRAMEAWDGRPARTGKPAKSLAGMLFPWLPVLGTRSGEVLDDGKRRVRSLVRRWNVGDGVPAELARWKADVFSSSEWDTLMAEAILPKLGATLRDDFRIDPRAQDLAPLESALAWHALVRPSHFARLFEIEFFPKWLDTLHVWLTYPGYNGDEVASWFEMWKRTFPDDVLANPAVAHGFDAGLTLIEDALRLGADAPSKLRKPHFVPLPPKPARSKSGRTATGTGTGTRAAPPGTGAGAGAARAGEDEITFRSLAEDFIAQADLLLLPLGKSHATTGKPLFRVARGVDGRAGVTVYVGQDAVFAQSADDGAFRAVTLDELVRRAGA